MLVTKYICSDSRFVLYFLDGHFQLLHACTVKSDFITKPWMKRQHSKYWTSMSSESKLVRGCCSALFFSFTLYVLGYSYHHKHLFSLRESPRTITDLFPEAWICFVFCVQDNAEFIDRASRILLRFSSHIHLCVFASLSVAAGVTALTKAAAKKKVSAILFLWWLIQILLITLQAWCLFLSL